MSDPQDPFAPVFGPVRGTARPTPHPADTPPGAATLPADALARLRDGEFSAGRMWDYAWSVAAGIEHDPNGVRHLSDDGESFVRYRASAPCSVAVEPDDARLRERLGREVVGRLEALVWDLGSPTEPEPPEEALHHDWELAMGGWELDEAPPQPCIWQPAKAPCLLEVRAASGLRVVGVLRALVIPVTAAMLANL